MITVAELVTFFLHISFANALRNTSLTCIVNLKCIWAAGQQIYFSAIVIGNDVDWLFAQIS